MGSLGSRVRKLRERSGLTAAELASLATLSPSMLSQVERDIVSPSISSLRRIANVLKVPAFYFLVDESPVHGIVVRRQERRTLKLHGYNSFYQLLSPSLDKRIEMISFELPLGESTCETLAAHEGEECLVVICGKCKVVLPDQEMILEEGDSIYLDQRLPHRVINIGEIPLVAISAITPPSF